MGSLNIQNKIKAGLAKAVNKTGSNTSERVYLMNKFNSADTPLDTPAVTISLELLPNAIFKSYNKELIGGNIATGDRQLVSNNDIEIKAGDTIKQGINIYVVINVDIKAPTSDVLVYIAQVRQQ